MHEERVALENRPLSFLDQSNRRSLRINSYCYFNSAHGESMLARSPARVAGHPLTGSIIFNEIIIWRINASFRKGNTAMTSQASSLRSKQSVILRLSVAFLLLLGTFASAGAATIPPNRCKDRCNDAFHVRKDLCRSIPLKHERKRCENAAKHAKDDCKHRCR